MRIQSIIAVGLSIVGVAVSINSRADVVADWNQIMLSALVTANLSPIVAIRAAAIVQTSVYDAVNGIQRRYAPYHVAPDAPRGASVRAAAIEAAHEALVKLFPAQKPVFDVQWAASLAAITEDGEFEDSESIARGLIWGQSVADVLTRKRGALAPSKVPAKSVPVRIGTPGFASPEIGDAGEGTAWPSRFSSPAAALSRSRSRPYRKMNGDCVAHLNSLSRRSGHTALSVLNISPCNL